MNNQRRVDKQPGNPQIDIRYNTTEAVYSSQFVLNAGDEELVVECSSGLMVDAASGRATLPVHTRLALSWEATKRLSDLLNQALQSRSTRTDPSLDRKVPTATSQPRPPKMVARLPKLPGTHV